jgi:phosphoribosyl-ATP pyrophosphohydrolase
MVAAKTADPALSWIARLLQAGRAQAAKKLAEEAVAEAVEVVVDALDGNNAAVIKERADLVYNSGGALGRRAATSGPRWRGASACSASPRAAQRWLQRPARAVTTPPCGALEGRRLRQRRSFKSVAILH